MCACRMGRLDRMKLLRQSAEARARRDAVAAQRQRESMQPQTDENSRLLAQLNFPPFLGNPNLQEPAPPWWEIPFLG